MDSEYSAELTSLTKSKKPYLINNKKTCIDVLQCSGDDMNAILTAGQAGGHQQTALPQLSPMSPMCSPIHQQQQQQQLSMLAPPTSIFLQQAAPPPGHIMSPTNGMQRPLIGSVPLGNRPTCSFRHLFVYRCTKCRQNHI